MPTSSSSSKLLAMEAISLPTPFIVGDVWAYLLISEDDVVLVDCGPKTDEAQQVLENELKKHGVSFEDISQLWLTHAHPDHVGLAGIIQDRSGCRVFAHKNEQHVYEEKHETELFQRFFEEHGIAEVTITEIRRQYYAFDKYFEFPKEINYVEQGAELFCGKEPFTVHEVFGHAKGQIAFEHQPSAAFFAGDVLLEHITSNALITFDEEGNRLDCLAQMRHSLNYVGEWANVVYPGHGRVVREPQKRAQEHLKAQSERYQAIQHHLKTPKKLMEMTEILFPIAKNPRFAFLPISEVTGYLDWGRNDGKVKRTKKNGVWVYKAK
jgi:glyoxylase-like metal-dependent hydrolase (beta-lactamase superfamily II)